MLAAPAREFGGDCAEESNRKPRGLRPEETTEKNDFARDNRARWR
jgi:hypothetical protein